ncbi:MAG: double-strand break repair protein AddB [Sneathiella sp.]|nr:MAG: double-strand break repair protein AddB [Sneathiella sp.]
MEPDYPKVSSIPPEYSFVDVLAKELLRRHGANLQELSTVTILTTTRRAARALQNAFLRETAGRPLMLPRMRPLGDVEEDELLLEAEMGVGGTAETILTLPPAIDPLRRQLLLGRLILARGRGEGGIAQAVGLAKELSLLLDQVQTEGLDLRNLKDLVPAEYAAHWQITLEFLEILSDAWPAILAEEGSIDPAARRDLLLRAQSEYWRTSPTDAPVYAVGSTGSIPATAELLKTVAGLPNGYVILPGLDRHLDPRSWEEVSNDPTHAQHGLARLLEKLGISREDVVDLHHEDCRSCPDARAALLAEALRPASTTDRWQEAAPPPERAISDVRRLDCLDPQAEAQTIALLLREALETDTKTAVLITPDRDLSRRVSAELLRWGVQVDDSAGISLNQSPPGVYLRLLARLFADFADPVSLLAALKHPFASLGQAPEDFRRQLRALELAVLRGPAPAAGFEGIARALASKTDDAKDPVPEELMAWFARLQVQAAELEALSQATNVAFGDFLTAFVRFAEVLSTPADRDGATLWEGPFGEAAAGFISELLRASDVMDSFTPSAWPELLDNLMTGRMVRPKYGQHPRLQIWGPIEGRVQRADLVVLGGLNEGSWPSDAGSDPWMSRPMRRDFRLPLPEQRIGLSAHDFQQAFCARELVLTRAEKIDGTPTVPSRWLLRLETVLKKFGMRLDAGTSSPIQSWQRQLDQPRAYQPCPAPRPTPPVSARPRRLSVTRIEKWMKDPYSIFAESILKLRPLAELAEDPGAAEKGIFIHAALEEFIRTYPDHLPADAEARLLEFGRLAFGDILSYPAVWAFWWPRFVRIARWFVAFERDRRQSFTTLKVEAYGKIDIPAPHATFTLSGTADRIDRGPDGGLVVIDYKTGGLPSVREVETGMAPQLALEAAMIARNGFAGVPADLVSALSYIRLSGADPAGFLRSAGKETPPMDLAAAAFEGLQRLITLFDKQATPYLSRPRPDLPGRFNDYEHLARVKEWSSGEASE